MLQGVWYYGSDVAMFFVFLYVWNTRRFDIVTHCFARDEFHSIFH